VPLGLAPPGIEPPPRRLIVADSSEEPPEKPRYRIVSGLPAGVSNIYDSVFMNVKGPIQPIESNQI